MKRFTRTVCVFLTAILICQLLPMKPVDKGSSFVRADNTGGYATSDVVAIDEVTFPDANFRAHIAEFCDTDGDGYLSEEEISEVKVLDIPSEDICNLTGIEFFIFLTELACYDNSITRLDVSGLKDLKYLDCACNSLTELDLTECSSLEYLAAGGNQLTSLNVSGLGKLEWIEGASGSHLFIDASNCDSLKRITADGCVSLDISGCNSIEDLSSIYIDGELESLDISNNSSITSLEITDSEGGIWALQHLKADNLTNLVSVDMYSFGRNLLTVSFENCNHLERFFARGIIKGALSFKGCTSLTSFKCYYSGVESIDLLGCTRLQYLECFSCEQLSNLDISTSSCLMFLSCSNCNLTDLTMVSPYLRMAYDDGILLKDEQGIFNKSDWHYYDSLGDEIYPGGDFDDRVGHPMHDMEFYTDMDSIIENGNYSLIVDKTTSVTFEEYVATSTPTPTEEPMPTVITNTPTPTDDPNLTVTTVPTGSPDVDPILDVAINEENFPDELFRVFISNNYDLDSDGYLGDDEIALVKDIVISQPGITSLHGIRFFDSLEELQIYGTQITTLSIDGCNNLTILVCRNNQLTSLDVSGCTKLLRLDCENNQLTSLDASGCTSLIYLFCNNNQLTSLDASGCTSLIGLFCNNNQLTSLDVRGCTSLRNLYCNNNQLTSLDVSGCTSLHGMYCDNNQLTSLDASGCTRLRTLYCNNNQLTSLDVSRCTNLDCLECCHNQLMSLDVSGCTSIRILGCNNNQLTSLGVSGYTNLDNLNCCHNQLMSLDVSGCTRLSTLECNNNQLTSLDVSGCTNLDYLNCSHNQLMSLDVSTCTNLKELHCDNNQLTKLNISECAELTNIECHNNSLKSLDLSRHANLTQLLCDNNQLSSLDISSCSNLVNFSSYANNLTDIDISSSESLVLIYNRGHIRSSGYWTYYIDGLGSFSFDDGVNVVTEANTPSGPTENPTPTPEPTELISPTSAPTVTPASDLDNPKPTAPILTPSEMPASATNTPSPAPSVEDRVTPRPTSCNSGNGSASTPTPSTRPIATNTSMPTTTPEPIPEVESEEAGTSGFVERLYSVALDRPSDPNGKADWINRIMSGECSGADAARGFFLSPEFVEAGLSDEEFTTKLYRTFFGREPDESGFNGWMNELANGASRESVLNGFINSTEWANLCLTYGIRSGGNGVPNITIEPSSQVIGFATRLYTTCLGRDADPQGLNDWANQLANLQISGSAAAHGFFFSEEFLIQNFSDDEYVTRLYRTFMDREPDPAGFADWTGRLANGATREEVFQGFAGSVEWAEICAEYGILK